MLRKSLFKVLATGLAMAVAGIAGVAQAATCGITGTATASGGVYDPFNPVPVAPASITLNLTRINPAGGGKTNVVNFYLKSSSAAADGITIVPTSVVVTGSVTGLNQNIFYNFAAAPPTIAPTTLSPIPPNNFLKIEFTGDNLASDTAMVTFQITVPPSLNLNASTTLPFNAEFACSTTGGGPPTQQTGSLPNAVTFPITVLSALQASFAGTALDFGEIGTVTTLQVTGAPGSYRTNPTNHVRVQSSGPYQVQLSSLNAFRLKHPSGILANAVETVGYNLKFLGQNKNFGNSGTPGQTVITQTCARAGVGASFEDTLGIQGTLLEGGQGKTPSPTYSDTLTVTVTPLAAATAAPTDCTAFTLP